MNCRFIKYRLDFRFDAGTSRGVLHQKDTYFILLEDEDKTALGECNLFKGLSSDDHLGYEEMLSAVCQRLSQRNEILNADLKEWPSIKFGVETVLKDWENGCQKVIFPEVIGRNGFSVPINALIWMGDRSKMKEQIIRKLKEGFTSVKLKIGAIDFEAELNLLKFIRKQFNEQELELRVDANGAWTYAEAKEKLKRLSEFGINYIEQPIKAGQWQEMAALAKSSPIKIALDEELIGVNSSERKKKLIEAIQPQILILKPALTGGFDSCDEWMNLIEKKGGSWVVTSALESNLGLNAIAQYVATKTFSMAQGLGTGQLYSNNFPSPYTVDSKGLHYHKNGRWDLSLIDGL